MRITGGEAKGNRLKGPETSSVRPTTDLARKAIFSILENTRSCAWKQMLDLYAGSGALGIEALSRGAEWVDFVDQKPQCCRLIKHNLEKTGFQESSCVYCCNVKKIFTSLRKSYDIVFLDPPYIDKFLPELLALLANSNLIATNSVVVACHATRFPLGPVYNELNRIKERTYGDTAISIYQKEDKL